MALTFTRAAALEMKERLIKLDVHGVTISTLHGLGLRLLVRRYTDGFGRRPNLVPRAQICRRLLDDRQDDRLTARQLDSEIGWATSRMLDVSTYEGAAIAMRRSLPVGFSDMANLISAYQVLKLERGVIDFDDLLLLPLEYLRQDSEWAAAVRWQYRHFYVDEYQDTSPLQFQLLQGLLGEQADVCVVGDPRQSIFGFAGAQTSAFEAFHECFPDAQGIELTDNFRSGLAIVGAGNCLTQTAMTTDGDSPPGQVVIQAYLDPEEEARAVAQALRADGPPWSHRAVLARTNRSLDLVEAALLEAQIPCYRTQDILKRPEVRRVLKELKRLAAQTQARSARSDLQQIAAEVLAFYNGERADEDLFRDDDDVALSTTPPDCGTLELKLIQHHLDELRDLLEEYVAANSSGTLDGFFFWLKASTQEPTATRAPKGTVDLRTVHRAKGLEWQTVYLVGCTADLLPLEYSGDEAEERRLMFVAVTRASDKLVCTWSMNGRDRRGRQVRRERSRYLTMIEAGVSAVALQEDRFSTTALSNLAAETIGQARAFLAGVDRNPPPPPTRGRQPAAPSLMDVAFRDRAEFNEDRALSGIAAHLGTSVGEFRARMEVDEALAAQARLALASAKHLFTPPKRDEERHP